MHTEDQRTGSHAGVRQLSVAVCLPLQRGPFPTVRRSRRVQQTGGLNLSQHPRSQHS